ncbi:MAG: RnfABCDGE type electron transport complex subunit D [Candidatus Izemoplasmataceae bacterium]
MEFTMKKPPIVQNSQSSLKRSFNLHIALIVVSIAAIILKAFTAVPDDATFTALDQAFKVFLMLAVGVGVSVIIELFYALSEGSTKKFESYEGFVDPINSGLLIALLLPTITPIYVLILAVGVGVYVGKLVFGGYGYYIFNPALVGVLFANVSFGSRLYVSGTPLELLKKSMSGETYQFENVMELFVGNYEAIAIGSTAAILLVFVMIYLIVTRVIDYRTVVAYLLTVGVISFIAGWVNGFLVDYVIVNMISGFTLFGAAFLVAEPVSSPTSRETKYIYAVVIGIMMMLVRVLGNEAEGLVFAVLFGNMITPFINRTVKRSNKQGLIKTVSILAVSVILMGFVLGFLLQNRLIEAFASLGGMM